MGEMPGMPAKKRKPGEAIELPPPNPAEEMIIERLHETKAKPSKERVDKITELQEQLAALEEKRQNELSQEGLTTSNLKEIDEKFSRERRRILEQIKQIRGGTQGGEAQKEVSKLKSQEQEFSFPESESSEEIDLDEVPDEGERRAA